KLLWRLGVLCTEPILSRLRSYFVEPLYNLGRSGDEHLSKVERLIHGVLESNRGLGEPITGVRGVINDVKQSVHGQDEYRRRIEVRQKAIKDFVVRGFWQLIDRQEL